MKQHTIYHIDGKILHQGEAETFREFVEKNKGNLKGAWLPSVNLTWANLENANLEGAWLPLTNLSGANLENANLTWANFDGAWLVGAKLAGAKNVNLENANLEVPIFFNRNY